MITYPLNNIDYTAEDAELYFSTRESGIYDGNDFEVTASGVDNDVIVGSGIAWIHNTKFSGKVVALKEPKTLTLSLPNSVYDRIDAIVVQFDANKNATEIIVKEGIASSSPVAPSVVRTKSLYELHIFHVRRKAGATVISIDDLVDLRNDYDYCGIMFDPISSVDSTLTKSGYAADAWETGKRIENIATKVEYKMSMELLWKNASPTSAFAAQTLSMDLTIYDFIMLTSVYSDTAGYYCNHYLGVDGRSHVVSLYPNDKTNVSRRVKPTSNGVEFWVGLESGKTENASVMIPVKIYGIKGVQ